MVNKIFTKQDIKIWLQKSDEQLIKALIRLYEYQTESEKLSDTTVVKNGVGFNGTDALILSSMARFAIERIARGTKSAQALSEKQIAIVRKKLPKYSGQLARIANGQ